MTDKDGDQYQDRLEEAKKQGKDFVLYDYQDFNARFAQCVWCDWIECLAVDWQDDGDATADLMRHAIKHHREGEFLDGSK